MEHIRPTQKVVFINNKWWVGKTTLAFNTAYKMAEQWHKTLLIDADPQCNLTLLALGLFNYRDLWLFEHGTIYNAVQPLIEWSGDINTSIKALPLRENLDIIPWNMLFGDFEDTLASGYSEIIGSANPRRWFMVTSWLKRFINELSINNLYRTVIIDVSPSVSWSINKNIMMLSDFFVTICNPDLFSEQGIMNLWEKISKRKLEQSNINTIATRDGSNIPASYLLSNSITFLWYIINRHKIYAEKIISDEQQWINEIKPKIKNYLSDRHGRNWLVELSYAQELGSTQDYGRIISIGQEKHKPLYEVTESEIDNTPWSIELLKKCITQINTLTENIITRLSKRGA